ncbi:hypothetical protein PY479_01310 [Shewanella sp. A32]|uniref:hypothetical protein n=1 Tax=Shewanella sp. A32 TaxID=3031327 RepID=UPI0023B9FF93|nr:hypothetical protein [Shewanella sp. A32]MDF0532912.1 hypothetical protein [Shewanella sp. A32]
MSKIFFFLTLLLLGGCSCSAYQPPMANVYMPDQHTLVFSGETRTESVKQALALVQNAKSPVTTLIITSTGSNPAGGMMLGEWVYQQQVAVEVREICAGSCANYIFTAASSVKVDQDAVIGFQGGAWQQHWDKPWYRFLVPGFDEHKCLSVTEWREREIAFFERIGVREEITLMGQIKPFAQQRSGKSWWSYRAADFSKFGLRQVHFTDNYDRQSKVDILEFAPGQLESYLATNTLLSNVAH